MIIWPPGRSTKTQFITWVQRWPNALYQYTENGWQYIDVRFYGLLAQGCRTIALPLAMSSKEFAGVYYSYISLANRFVSRDNETYMGWGLRSRGIRAMDTKMTSTFVLYIQLKKKLIDTG